MRILFLLLAYLLFNCSSIAQSDSDFLIDSLETVLAKAKNADRITPLIELAEVMHIKDTSQAIELSKEALQISHQSNDLKGFAQANYQLAKIYGETQKYQWAKKYARKALSTTIDENKLLLDIEDFNNLLTYLYYAGEPNEAISYSDKGIQLYQKKETARLSYLYRSKGLTLFKMGSFDASKVNLLIAQSLSKDLGNYDPMHQAGVLNSLAHLYESIGQYDSTYYYCSLISELGYKFNVPEIIVGSSINMTSMLTKRGLLDSALNKAKGTLPLAYQLKDKTLLRSNLMVVADCFNSIGKTDSAIFYLKETVDVCKKNQFFIFMVYPLLKLGQSYLDQDNLSEALKYALEALELGHKKSLPDNDAINNTYYLIGRIYQNMNELDKAISYFDGISDTESRLQTYLESQLSIGEIHLAGNEYEKAKKYFLSVLERVEKGELIETQLRAILNLSKLSQNQEDINQSQYWINKAMNFEVVKLEKSALYPQLLQTAAELALYSKEYPKSIDLFQKSLSFFDATKRPSLAIKCYEGLSAAHEKSNNYKMAYYFQNKRLQAQENLYNQRKTKLATQLKTQYETERKDQQILALEKEKQLKELTLANQQTLLQKREQQNLFILFGVLILLAGAVLFFNRYRLRKENEGLVLKTKQLELEVEQKNIKQQLEMAELRSDFFTNISHEFRTPLTLILGPLEKLLKQDQLENKRDIERIYRNAQQLLSLVNETLDLSKVENGHLPLAASSIVLGDYVSEVVHSFIPLSETQEIKLDFVDQSEGLLVDVDKNKLNKVLVNLLGNAFKHSKAGSSIEVSVKAPKDDSIVICVKDEGAGIVAEHLPYIFDRFYQGDSKAKGSGVGLALSKQLVELHSGTISVESEKGIGSTFYVQLPIKQKNVIADNEVEDSVVLSDATAKEIDLNERETILIIEDNDDVRAYLKELLENNYHVISANDGNKGVEMAIKNNPDLILSDVMIPHKDGFELTKYLKDNIATSHIPIILLTAKASVDSKIKGLETGADDYLGKPFHEDELLQRCKNLIQQRIQLRKLYNSNYFVSSQKSGLSRIDQDFLERAEAIVEKHMEDSDLTIEKFCQELAYNRSGVHVKLKALTGKNTSGFIRSIRIRKAAMLIKETSMSMSEIIEITGFGSRQAFNKAFKEQFNMAPIAFRKSDGLIPLA